MRNHLQLTLIMSLLVLCIIPLSAQNCSIRDVVAEINQCDSNGTFIVTIEFNYSNTGSQGFEIRGNGKSYGNFSYGQDFYTIGPLEGDCVTIYEFVVIDNDDPDCRSFTEFREPICCGQECDIRDVVIDSIDCNNDGTYGLLLDFIHENTSENGFTVFTEDRPIGRYSYDSLPIYIDTFYSRNLEYDFIKICDNNFPDCCEEFEFKSPECESNECRISELFAEVYDCDSSGVYFVDFEFDIDNPTGDGFIARGNGTVFGEFEYGERFYTIGPFDSCDEINELIIIDQGNENCSQAIAIPLPDCCDENECQLYDLSIIDYELIDSGDLVVTIDFLHENTNQIGYDVFVNGSFNTFNSYNEIPARITIASDDVTRRLVIKVCNNDDVDCCDEVLLEIENETDCEIEGLTVLQTDCDDGSYFYVVNFDFDERLSFTEFSLRGNGNFYGNYTYDDLPVTLGPFEISDTIDELVIISGDNNECMTAISLDPSCDMINSNNEILSDNLDIQVSQNHIVINNTLDSKIYFTLYDLTGQMITNKTINKLDLIETDGISNGIYVIRCFTQNASITQKISIVK